MKISGGKVVNIVVGVAVFFAALAEIASYVEQSKTPSRAAQMISSLVTPELLNLVYRLLLLFLVTVGFWRLKILERRLQAIEKWQSGLQKIAEKIRT